MANQILKVPNHLKISINTLTWQCRQRPQELVIRAAQYHIIYNIRQGDELQHYSNETSTAFQQQKWTKVHKYKHQMD